MSEVVYIVDFSLCFIQPAFHMMYSAYKLNKQGGRYTALTYYFPDLEPVCCSMSSSNCCFLTCIQISHEAGRMVWCRGPAPAGSREYPQDEQRWQEREKTRETSLDRAKSAREREREKEGERVWPDGGCSWQSLAMLYFLPWLLYPKLVHF